MIKCNMITILKSWKYDKRRYDKLSGFFLSYPILKYDKKPMGGCWAIEPRRACATSIAAFSPGVDRGMRKNIHVKGENWWKEGGEIMQR